MKTSAVLLFLIAVAVAMPAADIKHTEQDADWVKSYQNARFEDKNEDCPQNDWDSAEWRECGNGCAKKDGIMGLWWDPSSENPTQEIRCWNKEDWRRKEELEAQFIGGEPCPLSRNGLVYDKGDGYRESAARYQGGAIPCHGLFALGIEICGVRFDAVK